MKTLQIANTVILVVIGLALGNVLVCGRHLMAQTTSGSALAEEKKLPKSAEMTNRAWEALNAEKYLEAIKQAKECISEFRREAQERQKELAAAKEPKPPVGHVADKALKERILSWGPLNDVAACYFITGEANLKLSRRTDDVQERRKYRTEAKKAYEACAELTYARVYDSTPPTWFWNPAKKANERIQDEFSPSR
jgi:hypothetical protein